MILQHNKWCTKILLSKPCLDELVWLKTFLSTNEKIVKCLHLPELTTTVFSDASGRAYGDIWNNIETQGHFSEEQCKLSINTKELLAIYFTLGAHALSLKNQVVLEYDSNLLY